MIDPKALLQPTGPIDGVLFPNEQGNALELRLQQYLSAGYLLSAVAALVDESTKDVAARAWALYLAFAAVYTRMSAEPLSVTQAEKGSSSYSSAQIANIKGLRDQYLAEYQAIIAVPIGATHALGSMSVRNRRVF